MSYHSTGQFLPIQCFIMFKRLEVDAVALGELLIDFSCRSADSDGFPVMEAHPGGAPANWLSALSRFGCSAAFIGKVGKDSFGNLLVEKLKSCGISTRGTIQDANVFTTLAFVTFNEENDREFSFARKPGADTCLCPEEVDTSLIDGCRVFHFGTLSLTDEPARSATIYAVEHARKAGKMVSFDPNLRKPLWKDLSRASEEMLWGIRHCDVLKISDEEIEFLFGKVDNAEIAGRLIREYGVKLVFITMGKDGCFYANRNASGHVPGLSGLCILDTTGAGDIFGGSAMYGILKSGKEADELSEDELERITRFACISAGLSTEKPGGLDSVPRIEAIIKHGGLL